MNWKKMLLPHGLVIALLSISGAVGLIYVFSRGLGQTPLAYGVYALSFYALCTLCAWFVLRFPGFYRRVKQRLEENPVSARYLHDPVFKAQVSLWRSLAVNGLFVCVQALSWHLSGSAWYGILAVYYAILALLRLLLLGPARGENAAREKRRAKLCGWILLLLNLTLSAAILMILYQGKGHRYQGVLIYVMAMYSFYALIRAAVDLVRFRKLGRPALHAAKAVSLCAALVSMLNLETAMFAQFGQDMPQESQHLMIILTGAGVSLGILITSLWTVSRRTYGK